MARIGQTLRETQSDVVIRYDPLLENYHRIDFQQYDPAVASVAKWFALCCRNLVDFTNILPRYSALPLPPPVTLTDLEGATLRFKYISAMCYQLIVTFPRRNDFYYESDLLRTFSTRSPLNIWANALVKRYPYGGITVSRVAELLHRLVKSGNRQQDPYGRLTLPYINRYELFPSKTFGIRSASGFCEIRPTTTFRIDHAEALELWLREHNRQLIIDYTHAFTSTLSIFGSTKYTMTLHTLDVEGRLLDIATFVGYDELTVLTLLYMYTIRRVSPTIDLNTEAAVTAMNRLANYSRLLEDTTRAAF